MLLAHDTGSVATGPATCHPPCSLISQFACERGTQTAIRAPSDGTDSRICPIWVTPPANTAHSTFSNRELAKLITRRIQV